MKKKISLVGCGNIGSRHLQALVKLPDPLDIEIVEPNGNAQTLAKSRLEEINYEKTNFNFSWHESINTLDKSDLVIVATPSSGRVNIIKQLLELGNSRFLIEKMVCQSAKEYELLLKIMNKANARGWVNTTRRYFDSYKRIKEFFDQPEIIHFSAISYNEGLGSNAIHMIDLFSWLCNNNIVTLNGDLLYDKLFENKRGKNFVEFAGTITGSVNNGSTFQISFLPYENIPSVFNIVGDGKFVVIDEINNKMEVLEGPENLKKIKFQNELVSNVTQKIVKDIFESDDCCMPKLEDIKQAHYELFRIFNNHIKKLTNNHVNQCPIT